VKGFRFQKSFNILPWVKLNFSKTGVSASIGPKGARVITGPRGTFVSLDLPGSGTYFRRKIGSSSSDDKEPKPTDEKTENADSTQQSNVKSEQPQSPVDVGVVDRLTLPGDELALIDAVRTLSQDDLDAAYEHARQSTTLADGAFIAGFLALRKGDFATAEKYLTSALEKQDKLGEALARHNLTLTVDLPITDDFATRIAPDRRGLLLALADTYQNAQLPEPAIETLLKLYELDPNDLVVRLSLAELYSERYPDSADAQKKIVQYAEGVHNESPLHASLMLYRARALRKLNLLEAAQDTLTEALRRKKDYPPDLLIALRYERALLYEATGKAKQARSEFEKLYAEAPTFADVAAKVGL
jgi:tetratricopeptide (TPR) repeat protein